VKILHLERGSASQIYALVDKLGPEITKLTFGSRRGRGIQEPTVDLSKVLSACSNIETLEFLFGWSFETSSTILKAETFVNCGE